MISKETRNTIKGYLEGFIQGMVDEAKHNGFDPKQLRPLRNESKDGELKPFHESLLLDGVLRVAEFERSFSTKLGTTFEECARLIAKSVHKNAERGFRVRGVVTAKAIKRIEAITNQIGSGGMKWKYPDLVKEVVELSEGGRGVERVSIADLFIETKSGEEWFFEIKSPKPNKGQCLEATGRLLQVQAITHEKYPKAKAFYATAYNPYGIEKSTYRHSFVVNYMDLASEVLVGKEFWDLIGGKGTYEEVLSIYQEVGKEKGPDMLDQLALGY
ncbi:MAG: TdeIII family type II restriction endonuclease [Patescibacteria group bacterium]